MHNVLNLSSYSMLLLTRLVYVLGYMNGLVAGLIYIAVGLLQAVLYFRERYAKRGNGAR